MSSEPRPRRQSKTLKRLRLQAAQTRRHHGITIEVDPGRMALRIGPFKIWVPGYTITIRSPGAFPSVARVRTSKSCGDILRGIGMHSFHTGI
jgi:hypothetical protein